MRVSGAGLESKPEENKMSNGNGGTGAVGEQAHGIEDQAHGNGGNTQEAWLANTSLWGVIIRGIKKLVVEISSVKTLAMVAITGLIWFQKMDSMAGVIGLLGLVGAREINFDQITEIIKNKWGR